MFVHNVDGQFIAAVVWTDDVLFAYDKGSSATYERFLAEVYGKRWLELQAEGSGATFRWSRYHRRSSEKGDHDLNGKIY